MSMWACIGWTALGLGAGALIALEARYTWIR